MVASDEMRDVRPFVDALGRMTFHDDFTAGVAGALIRDSGMGAISLVVGAQGSRGRLRSLGLLSLPVWPQQLSAIVLY